MALESATYISGLVDTNPSGSDSISQGDDHLRLIKDVLKNSFPDVDQVVATVVVKATAPTTQVKGTIWYDTSTGILKLNTANTGSSPSWLNLNGPSFCSFHVTMGSTQSLPNNTYTIMEFDTESFDIGSNFDTSTYKFTAPVAGKYYFNAAMRSSATHGSDDDLAIYKNASAYVQESQFNQVSGPAYVTSSNTMNISCIMDMAASDTASVYANTETGPWTMGNTSTVTFFEGFRIA
tara:strand:- start:38 stop:745 length:708 start_codon:yes stop_codon:yes gene_type:complete